MIEPKLARHMWWVLGCVSLYLGPTKNQRSGLWYCGVYPVIPGVVAFLDARKLSTYHFIFFAVIIFILLSVCMIVKLKLEHSWYTIIQLS